MSEKKAKAVFLQLEIVKLSEKVLDGTTVNRGCPQFTRFLCCMGSSINVVSALGGGVKAYVTTVYGH